jgi:hypothetical protein
MNKDIQTIKDYIQNIRLEEKDGGLWYSGEFGRNGAITWEITESQKNDNDPSYIIIQSIDRNKYSGKATKEDSKGEGTKALASLFFIYPSVNMFLFDDNTNFNFWEKIGAKADVVERFNFFKYYDSRNES